MTFATPTGDDTQPIQPDVIISDEPNNYPRALPSPFVLFGLPPAVKARQLVKRPSDVYVYKNSRPRRFLLLTRASDVAKSSSSWYQPSTRPDLDLDPAILTC